MVHKFIDPGLGLLGFFFLQENEGYNQTNKQTKKVCSGVV